MKFLLIRYAPEAISIGKFTTKSDVWSFGITLWEMFSYAATPYGSSLISRTHSSQSILFSGDMSGTDVYYYLQHGKRLERPTRCPSSTYQLMLKCWEWEEKKRPTFSQLLHFLKTDPDYRDTNKSIPISNTLSRKKSLKTTLSSSTLTDENTRDNDDDIDEPKTNHRKKSEQYKSNGNNGHVSKTIMHFQQGLTKERTNS